MAGPVTPAVQHARSFHRNGAFDKGNGILHHAWWVEQGWDAMSTASVAPASGWPRAAASAAVFRGGAVLLVERAKPPRGFWSLPGGHIEPGETAAGAAAREVWEETGLEIKITGLVDVHDVIRRSPEGAIVTHYLLAVYFAHHHDGEPRAASDALAAEFVPLANIGARRLTPGAHGVILKAARLAGLDSAAGV
jgi:ADP-ribose pyrophosphatase YjhB (NUDIX family)